MKKIRSYIISVVAAAIVTAVVKIILPEKNTTGKMTGLICRIMLVVTVVAPLRDIKFTSLPGYIDNLSAEGAMYVAEGKTLAEIQTADIIKQQTEAYILDKANRMGLEISVEVELDGNHANIPCGVIITGNLSPYSKVVLSSYMTENLGISKENQDWN